MEVADGGGFDHVHLFGRAFARHSALSMTGALGRFWLAYASLVIIRQAPRMVHEPGQNDADGGWSFR